MVRACIAIGIILLDQISKLWAAARLGGGTEIVLIPDFLRLIYTENRGAAFSILADHPAAQNILPAFSIIGALLFAYLLYRERGAHHTKAPAEPLGGRLWSVALLLLLGGTVGNLIDRLRLGYVIDFIAVNFASYAFPVFNTADAAIVLGVALMTLHLLTESERA